jgi:hypothetical protein
MPTPAGSLLVHFQLPGEKGSSIRSANQQLAACGLQVRNEDDHWQLTEAGLDWGMPQPVVGLNLRQQRILWHPAVVTLLHQEA